MRAPEISLRTSQRLEAAAGGVLADATRRTGVADTSPPPFCLTSLSDQMRVPFMLSLADLPELVGFFSYAREDDDGALATLREQITRELQVQLGRSARTLRIWPGKEEIAAP